MKKNLLLVLLFFSVAFVIAQPNLEGVLEKDGKLILPFTEELQSDDLLPQRTVEGTRNENVEITFEFAGGIVTEITAKNEPYQFIHIEGFAKMDEVGNPALPSRNEIIAMPKGATGKVSILSSEYTEYKGYQIHPALEPARDTEGAPEPEFTINSRLYNTNSFFPNNIVEILDVGISRGTPLAKTQIRPVQYNPVTGTIRVYNKIKFKLEFTGGEGSFDSIKNSNSLHYTNLLKLNVINSNDIPNGIPYHNVDDRSGKNYIIITHSQYLSYANDLADWKRQLGYSVEVVSQSSWTASQVKTEIQDRYNSWTVKPDYFLIIGDHTGSYAVPGEVHQDPYDGDDFATDLYYACMDGSTDWHPDMAHGRISVSSTTEANTVINKIINYEKNPPTSSTFYSNMLSCAQYQDDDNNGYADRRFCHTSEDIRDYMQDDQNYSSTRVYYTDSSASVSGLRYNNSSYSDGQLLPSDLRSTSFDWTGGSSEITSEINAGKFLVFHRDHGYTGGSGWAHPYYTTSSMTSLSNGDELPVVFSMNCHTGEFQVANCFAENFLRMQNKGAVGVVGAAYFSLSGWNDALSEGMIDAIWANPGIYPNFGSGGAGTYTIGSGNEIYTMGDVVNQGLYAMEQNWGGSSIYDQYEYELFHWFGDPAMRIWTSNPNNNTITANHANEIQQGSTSFSITSSNCSDGIATLVFDGELIGKTTLSGGSGTISFSAIGSSSSDAILTISKQNHKPYVATLPIGNPSGVTVSITNPSDNSVFQSGNSVSIAATAATNTGYISNVSFYIDNVLKSTDSSSPYQYNWNTTGYAGGSHEIKVVATNSTSDTAQEIIHVSLFEVINTFPYNEDFSDGSLPDSWENSDNQGNGQIWEFNNPGARTFSSTTGSNGFAILDSDHYGSGNSQNADLLSPLFDFSGNTSVTLEFEHYFKSYSGSSASLSYSTNGGTSWTSIQSWSADTANPVSFSQTFTSGIPGSSAVRFKWNYTGSYGWYWCVDDVSVTTSGSNPAEFSVSPTSLSYGSVAVGSSSVKQFSISNTGGGTLSGNITTPSGYTIAQATRKTEKETRNTLSYSISGGSSQTYNVTFAPTSAISYNGTISITCNEDTPTNVSVTGTGTAPEIVVNPTSINQTLEPDNSTTSTLQIQNTGNADLTYSLQIESSSRASGGPDNYGYSWKDSNESDGPNYSWVDISSIGTALTLADDAISSAISLPFTFSFYGNDKSSIYVCSNGFLSFNNNSNTYNDATIPTSADPNDLIAPFWDDLKPTGGEWGTVYYHGNSTRFVVQYENVSHYGSSSVTDPVTFEVILYPNGEIVYQYKTIGTQTDHHIGIENVDGSIGLQIAASGYATNGLAVLISTDGGTTEPDWLTCNTNGGTIQAGMQDNAILTYDATGLEIGTYQKNIVITSNDSDEGTITIPVSLTVEETAVPEFSVSPTSLAFGNVSVGNNSVKQFTISNIGGGTLTGNVTTPTGYTIASRSDLTKNRKEKTRNTVTYSIAGGSSQTFNVTFTPTSAISYNGAISISCNEDTSTNVSVTGTGTAPEILINPTSISHSIQPNDTSSGTLQIKNEGNENLTYSASVSYGRDAKVDLISEDFATFPPTGWSTTGGTNWQGNSSNSAGGTSPEARFNWSPDTTAEQKLITSTVNTSGMTSLTLEFKHMIDHYGDTYSMRVETSSNGSTWNTIATYPAQNLAATTESLTISNSDVGSSTFRVAFVFDGRSYNINYWYIDDVVLSGVSQPTDDWLSLNGTTVVNGTVNPGITSTITTGFDSNGLTVGIYNASITITSNDSDEPTTNIPVTLNVEDNSNPQIGVNVTSLSFGDVEVGQNNTKQFVISNTGDATLSGSISTSDVFSVAEVRAKGQLIKKQNRNTISYSIIAGNSKTYSVTFSPASVQSYTGSVSISSNDTANPNVSINLAGTGFTPAEISLSETSYVIQQDPSESQTNILTINNSGSQELTYSISTNYGTPSKGSVNLIDENFNGGTIPSGWQMTTNSSVGWAVTTDGSSGYWAIPAGDGYYACSNDDAANDDGSVDYLITPLVDLSNANSANLSFNSFFTGGYNQVATVKVSTDGSSWTPLHTVATNDAWNTVNVDLSSYINQQIYILFHSDDAGAWASGWAIDDVVLTADISSSNDSWLFINNETSITGSVNGNSSVDVNIQTNSSGIDAGIYEGYLNISSNDSDEAVIDVSVTMNITENYPEWNETNYSNEPAHIHAEVTKNGIPADFLDLVAAFYGNEIRDFNFVDWWGDYTTIDLYIECAGGPEQIYFELYSFWDDEVYVIELPFVVEPGGEYGTSRNPVILNADTELDLHRPVVEAQLESNSLSLQWAPIPEATSYKILGSFSPETNFVPIDTTTNTSWSISADATSYRFFKIVAVK